MLRSTEDAEDVLQEVFAAAYGAICADERPIKARPWLYRIARNRCLNELRRPSNTGQDSMDVFEREAGATAADTVHHREEFRQIVVDVRDLPETQRTALLLRELETLSYNQIAEVMDTSVPSVKSLLVRARVSLAEAVEARRLTCAEVRLELGQAAEGVAHTSSPVRRHVRSCQRCRDFRRDLRRTGHALGALYPVGVVAAVKGLVAGGSSGAGSAAQGGSTMAGGAALASGGAGLISAAAGSMATKAAAGLVAAALVTAGALEADSPERSADSASPSPPSPAEVPHPHQPRDVAEHDARPDGRQAVQAASAGAVGDRPRREEGIGATPAPAQAAETGRRTTPAPAPVPGEDVPTGPRASGSTPTPSGDGEGGTSRGEPEQIPTQSDGDGDEDEVVEVPPPDSGGGSDDGEGGASAPRERR